MSTDISAGASAIVIGAGIVGAACALELADAGFAVTVVDAGPVGGGATAAGMGHVVVMDDSPAQLALTRYSQQLWTQLQTVLPPQAEIMRCGTIWVAADAEEMAEVERKRHRYLEEQIPCDVLDAGRLYQLEPNLRPGLAGGLLIQQDSVVYPPTIAAWMLDRVTEKGGTVRTHTQVDRVEPHCVILSNGDRLAGDVIVNAAGAVAPRLTPGLHIKQRKGHLIITDRYPNFVRHQLVELGYLKSAHQSDGDSVAFNVQPRPSGQLLIGSSRQYDESRAVDHVIVAKMVARAIEYMPAIAELSATRVWTGFRAATPDKLPLIGPSPANDGLWLAAGHEGLGITTSLATARLLVDQIMGRTSAIPVAPYLPSRAASEAMHV
ncbi:MAG: FAD-binding oxidoreductase [Burkholderiales bacterium]|nr:FAD-binding oxidoreductase [Phycisphaerae bacterium]